MAVCLSLLHIVQCGFSTMHSTVRDRHFADAKYFVHFLTAGKGLLIGSFNLILEHNLQLSIVIIAFTFLHIINGRGAKCTIDVS